MDPTLLEFFKIVLIPAAVTLVLSGILIPICTKIVGRQMTKYFDKKDEEKAKQDKDNAELALRRESEKAKELEDKIDSIVDNHTAPIDKELAQLTDKLAKVADGTMDTLRDRILSSYYKCLEKGYRTEYDIENVNHMNKDYLALNGNTFVSECMEKFKNIPTEKEYQIIKQREEERKANRKTKRAKKTTARETKKEE